MYHLDKVESSVESTTADVDGGQYVHGSRLFEGDNEGAVLADKKEAAIDDNIDTR